MDTSTAMTKIEAAIEQQVLVAGGDSQVEAAARVMVAALEPAIRQLAMELAEQAAVEVAAQLAGYDIDVVLADGEPTLRVRPVEEETISFGESMDARITLRLPPNLKELIESAADEKGESLNTWLVKTISTRTGSQKRRKGRRVEGMIET